MTLIVRMYPLLRKSLDVMISFEEQILVNQWVQEVCPTTVLLDWYASKGADEQAQILSSLLELCQQARVNITDGANAVHVSGINIRRSACVLLLNGAQTNTLRKLSNLQFKDGQVAFVLFLHLLRLADSRRRSNEAPGSCKHWWHQDLGNAHVLDSIRKAYLAGQLT